MGELRDEGREAGHHRPHEEGCPEDPDELSDGLEEDDMGGQRGLLGERLFVVFQGSGDDDGHGVVENALAEHQSVQVDVDVKVVEDCEAGHWKDKQGIVTNRC